MAKVIVGITGNEKEMPAMSGIKYVAVAQDLSEGVKQAGGLPIVIPIGKPELAKDYVDMVDKLILSGGQHVDPRFYGQEKEIDSDDYSLARDQFELALIKEALRQKKPIFAVCRGMQCSMWPWAAASINPFKAIGRRMSVGLPILWKSVPIAGLASSFKQVPRSTLSTANLSRTWHQVW